MNLTKKYKAFTLTETIFGLIITSALIGVIYMIFTTFNKQFIMFQQQQLQSNAYVLFDATFKQDLYDATVVSYQNEQLIIKNYKEEIKIYTTQNDSLIRTFDKQSTPLLTNVVSLRYTKQEKYHTIDMQVKLYDEIINLKYQKKEHPTNVINETFAHETRY
ncbi:hypothetical protein [uncultured Kordia sp.]|uniref:hypothetical protein n=1 Tax=uncultured Kordia sp. TaxID=507699 RepID=UPI0026132DFD|nr:hypothetical protein [uncultured Kordia sp.]